MDINGIALDFLGHSGFLLQVANKILAIDPYNVSEKIPKVDYILITHSHYDHCSIKDIAKLSKEGTTILVPPDAQSKITRVQGVHMQVIELGDSITFSPYKIETVPAYNPKKPFHPKNEHWFGYLIKYENTIVYHAGDTDNIPEMQKLTGYAKHGNHFITLLPVSGTYVMTAEEASQVAALLKPALAIPMHFGAGVAGTSDDAHRFVHLCKEQGINSQVLEKI